MTMVVWPADLPQQFLVENSTYGFGDGRIRTEVEAGPPRTRRRFSAVAKPATITLRGYPDTMARLQRFWDEDTDGGLLPFLLPEPRRDGMPLITEAGLVLLDDQGNTLILTSWWTCLFGGQPPSPTGVSGDNFLEQVSFPVLRMP